MYVIKKEFHFSASHVLMGLAPEHPCSRLHGHNYIITVELMSSVLDEVGFVTDYRGLDPIKGYIDRMLDHRHLNDVWKFNPTAENIAKKMFEIIHLDFPQCTSVSVKETEKTEAIYYPNDSDEHVCCHD
jgi:6-pyruvoyltetrahydropterin/6-carboxytetrahydropterin synthase